MMPAKDPLTGKFLKQGEAPTVEPGKDNKPDDKPKPGDKKVDTTAIKEFARHQIGRDDKPTPPEPEQEPDGEAARVEKEKDEKDKADLAAKKESDAKKATAAKKPAAQPKREALTEDQIAEAAARGTAKAHEEREARREKQEPEPEKKNGLPKVDLPPSEQRKVDHLRHMEKIFPDRAEYKNIADRYIKSLESYSAHADKWEAANPGQTFDDSDEQHAEFLRKNDVTYDQDDYVEALADIRVQAAVEQREAKVNERLSRFEKQEKLNEARPYIENEKTRAARKFWRAFGDEYADVVSETGAVDRTKLSELEKKDPDAYLLQLQSADRLDVFVNHSYALINGLMDFNPDNKVHVYLSNFALSKEKELMKRAPNERVDGQGRSFIARSEFHKLSEEQQQRHWTFSVTDLSMLLADEESGRVSRVIQDEELKFKRRAEARGLKLVDKPTDGKNGDGRIEGEDEEEEEAEERVEKPRSPQSASESKVAATAKRGSQPAESPASTFGTRFLGA